MAVVHQSFATANATGTSLTINKPTGTVSGDLLLAWIYKSDTPTFPAGWTFAVDLGFGGGGSGGSLYYKIAGGSEPASYTITQATSGKIAGGISRYSGVDNVTPFDTTFDYQGTTGGASGTLTVTTSTADAMVIGGVASVNTVTVTPPSGMTERWETAGVEHASVIQAVAGSTGGKQWSFGTSSTYDEAFLTALRGASPSQTINASFVGSAEQVYSATLLPTLYINASFVPTAEQVFLAQIIKPGEIPGPFVPSGETVFPAAISVTSGPQTVTPSFVGSSEQVFPAQVVAARQIAASFVPSSEQVFLATASVSGLAPTRLNAVHEPVVHVVVDHEPL